MGTTHRCKPILPVAVFAISLATVTDAQMASQSIFKCVDGDITSYQSKPCGGGQTEVRLMNVARASGAQAVDAAPKVLAPVPTAQTPGRTWPSRRSLVLGMPDDEVLNLPGWGPPTQITRTKAPREWREEWTYRTPTGERKLYFVNATLVDAVVDPQAAQQVAIQQIERRTYPAT